MREGEIQNFRMKFKFLCYLWTHVNILSLDDFAFHIIPIYDIIEGERVVRHDKRGVRFIIMVTRGNIPTLNNN